MIYEAPRGSSHTRDFQKVIFSKADKRIRIFKWPNRLLLSTCVSAKTHTHTLCVCVCVCVCVLNEGKRGRPLRRLQRFVLEGGGRSRSAVFICIALSSSSSSNSVCGRSYEGLLAPTLSCVLPLYTCVMFICACVCVCVCVCGCVCACACVCACKCV